MFYRDIKREVKESIVDSFYNCHIDTPVIVTTLAGPNFDRIASLAYKSLNPIEINSYEIDPVIFKQQQFHLDFSLSEEVADICKIYFQDINKCFVSNFMDIDLMGTILTQGNTVRQLLEQQSYLEGTKAFIGTFSVRLTGVQTTLSYIRNIIGLILKSTIHIDMNPSCELKATGLHKPYKYNYKSTVSKRVESLNVYHYYDQAGPMVTFRIIYK